MVNKTLVKEWIRLAEEDDLWAKASFKEEIYKGACFAAQQSAEKYLKAYIIANDLNFEKVHDLKRLTEICANQDKTFEELGKYVEDLSPFYLETRYPGFMAEITKEQAVRALEEVEYIAEFVKKKLSNFFHE